MKYDLYDLLKELELKSEEIDGVFPDSYFLDHAVSMLWDIILFELKIEDEGKMDEISGILYDFGQRKFSKKKAIEKICKISKVALVTSSRK